MRDRYTYEDLKEIALQFTSRSALRKSRESALKAINRNGYIELLSHMPVKNKVLTDADILILAKECGSRASFSKHYSSAYQAARRRGLLDVAFKHLDAKGYSKRRLSIDEIKGIAMKFNTRREFELGAADVYAVATKKGLLDELFGEGEGYINVHWSTSSILKEARKFDTPISFKSGSKAYAAAITAGILEEATAHMRRKHDTRFEVLKDVNCVYILYRDGVVVYVGKSINCRSRVLVHLKEGTKDFDSFKSMEIPNTSDSDLIEVYLIGKHLPQYNKANKNKTTSTIELDYSSCVVNTTSFKV